MSRVLSREISANAVGLRGIQFAKCFAVHKITQGVDSKKLMHCTGVFGAKPTISAERAE